MALRIVRLGSSRARGEGLRLGTVRRPPRGVPKAEHASRDFYDVWLPDLAPSESLVEQATNAVAPMAAKVMLCLVAGSVCHAASQHLERRAAGHAA